MARATYRDNQCGRCQINHFLPTSNEQLVASREVVRKHNHPELVDERLESICEYHSSEGRSSENDCMHEEGSHSSIKFVTNGENGNEQQRNWRPSSCCHPEPLGEYDKSIKCCQHSNGRSSTVQNNSSAKGLEYFNHKTVTKQISPKDQTNNEHKLVNNISNPRLTRYNDSFVCPQNCSDITCCSTTSGSVRPMRPSAGTENPKRLDGNKGQLTAREVALRGFLSKERDQTPPIKDGCVTSNKSAGFAQTADVCLDTVRDHDISSCIRCSLNQTPNSFTTLTQSEKKKYPPSSLIGGSPSLDVNRAASRAPYVTTINLTNEQQHKAIDQFCPSRSSSLTQNDQSKEDFKKYCTLLSETQSITSDFIDSSSATRAISGESGKWNCMNWEDAARRYRKMPGQHRGRFMWQMGHSCFCNLLVSTLITLFPIFSAFKKYSIPGDLFNDLVAGCTIAVLQIPQGMAYGLLAGVEPIYGLYVSLVPVLVMAFMSRSYHVSYGTFAMVSMMLVSVTESVKLVFKQQFALQVALEKPLSNEINARDLGGLVVTNNHQPADPSQQMLKNLILAHSPTSNLDSRDDAESLNWTAADSTIAPLLPLLNQASFVMPTNIEILTVVCLMVGLIQVGLAMIRLGILSLMFSDQLVSAFTVAAALHVITSQLGALFDIDLPSSPDRIFKMCYIWWQLAIKLNEGFNQYTALLSFFTIVFLLSIKELVEPALKRRFKSIICLPSELAIMSFLIFASWYWKFEDDYNIKIIGLVPTGLPAPKMPRLDIAPLVLQDCVTIALVSFALNISLVQVYAKRFKYKIDPNQELFALGTSNVVGSFFSCFPCASSLSRSAVQSSLNVKSPLCSLFSCTVVISIICYFAPILHDLPRSTLSCIVCVALKGILIQIKDLPENWRRSKLDAFVWMVTFGSVFTAGITYGLVIGIIASLLTVLFRLLTPNHSILGQLPSTEIYVDTGAFMASKEIDRVKIFRFNSALCYLNRTMFKSCVEKSLPSIYNQRGLFCSAQQRARKDENKTLFLIIDCSALAYCDYSGAATLVDIIEELEMHRLGVYLAAPPVKLINMIERMQKTKILEQNVYSSISEAVSYINYLMNKTPSVNLIGSLKHDSNVKG